MILPEETRLRILLNGLLLHSILTYLLIHLLTHSLTHSLVIRLEEIRANGTPNMVVMLIGTVLFCISYSLTHSLLLTHSYSLTY